MTAHLVQDALSNQFYAAAATHIDGAVQEVDPRIAQALTQELSLSPTFENLTDNYNFRAAQDFASRLAATVSDPNVELASKVNAPQPEAPSVPTGPAA